jgi:thymidylate kinase
MSKKIIAISATHGCGKTTTAYSLGSILKKNGKNVVILNELARESPFSINKEAGDATHIWLSCKQIVKELEYSNLYEYVITDRSVLDAFAYGSVLNTNNDWIFKELEPYLVQHIKKYYKKLFLLDPKAFNYNIEDGIRDNDKQFRLAVHDKLLDIYNQNDIEYEVVYNTVDIFVNFV